MRNARTLSFGERGHLVKTRYRDVAPILDSSLLVRNLDQLEARVPPKAHVCLCHGAAASHLILRSDDADSRLVDWGAAGVDYAAWDLARALHDDCEDLPELSDRRAFVQEYLATLHDEPPASIFGKCPGQRHPVFYVCDNYLRGFLLVERAHAAAKDVDAGGPVIEGGDEAAPGARAAVRRGLVMCYDVFASSRRGDFFASVPLRGSFASCRWHS